MTRIIKMSENSIDRKGIRYAANQIKSGKLVVFPTETVYGIGASVFNEKACREIFKVKNRAADNPLIVHICSFDQLKEVAVVPDNLLGVLRKLWPGPMTFIFKRRGLPKTVTAGLDTVAVRMPSNRIALELIKESGVPIAAPSANISTFPSATEARHAVADFFGKVAVIIDGGRSRFGLESTVVDVSRKPYRLLRPGSYDVNKLENFLGKIKVSKSINKTVKKGKVLSPGMKYRHYSPKKPLFLFNSINELISASRFLESENVKFAALIPYEYRTKVNGGEKIILGSNNRPEEVARNLFSSFRKLDEIDADIGLIADLRLKSFDLAVRNRVVKAAGENRVKNLKQFIEFIRKNELDS
ncbi:L-threonylcarbamoyladenylate synthase [Candidatus Parvarchaeota archaeon]|nr:L-threonylcarbamoyladenylate synthase [Candidatus Parvarchaeota archaeon]